MPTLTAPARLSEDLHVPAALGPSLAAQRTGGGSLDWNQRRLMYGIRGLLILSSSLYWRSLNYAHAGLYVGFSHVLEAENKTKMSICRTYFYLPHRELKLPKESNSHTCLDQLRGSKDTMLSPVIYILLVNCRREQHPKLLQRCSVCVGLLRKWFYVHDALPAPFTCPRVSKVY